MSEEKGTIAVERIRPEETSTGCEMCGKKEDLVLLRFKHNRPTMRPGIALCRYHRERLVFVVSGWDVLADSMGGGK